MYKRTPSAATIARVTALIIFLVNAILALFSKGQIPFTEDQINTFAEWLYLGISGFGLVVSGAVAAWKNNSFSKSAIEADKYKDKLKATSPK